ncbi:MAG: hypothetical protein GX547_16215 [Phycisphaerae bacterium]|nr:hypothetical protein [Phycisphaerae bacterium]
MDLAALLAAVAAHLDTEAAPAAVTYTPEADLAEITARRVLVCPAYAEGDGPLSEEPAARRITRQIGRVAVAFAAPVAEADDVETYQAEFVSLMSTLRHARLAGYPAARWLAHEVIAAPSPDHLRGQSLFLAVFHATYQVHA